MVTSDKLKILFFFFFSILLFSPKYTYALITGIDEKHSDMPWEGCHEERKKRTKRSRRSRAPAPGDARCPAGPRDPQRWARVPVRSRPRRGAVFVSRQIPAPDAAGAVFGAGSVRGMGQSPPGPKQAEGLALALVMCGCGRREDEFGQPVPPQPQTDTVRNQGSGSATSPARPRLQIPAGKGMKWPRPSSALRQPRPTALLPPTRSVSGTQQAQSGGTARPGAGRCRDSRYCFGGGQRGARSLPWAGRERKTPTAKQSKAKCPLCPRGRTALGWTRDTRDPGHGGPGTRGTCAHLALKTWTQQAGGCRTNPSPSADALPLASHFSPISLGVRAPAGSSRCRAGSCPHRRLHQSGHA